MEISHTYLLHFSLPSILKQSASKLLGVPNGGKHSVAEWDLSLWIMSKHCGGVTSLSVRERERRREGEREGERDAVHTPLPSVIVYTHTHTQPRAGERERGRAKRDTDCLEKSQISNALSLKSHCFLLSLVCRFIYILPTERRVFSFILLCSGPKLCFLSVLTEWATLGHYNCSVCGG